MTEPPRIRDIDKLDAGFRAVVETLLERLCEDGIPVVVYETLRTPERQDYLFHQHVTKLQGMQGPHCHGLAVDFILDVLKVTVRKREGYLDAWDDETPLPVAAWMALGHHAEALGLQWGGRFKPIKSNGLGWDCPHVQQKGA